MLMVGAWRGERQNADIAQQRRFGGKGMIYTVGIAEVGGNALHDVIVQFVGLKRIERSFLVGVFTVIV